MPKMSEQTKKAAVFQSSRKKREQEVSAMQDLQKQPAEIETSSSSADATAAKRVGRPPSDKTAKMSIVMDPDLRRKLKTYCAVYGTTAADVIDKLVRDMLTKSNIPDLPDVP